MISDNKAVNWALPSVTNELHADTTPLTGSITHRQRRAYWHCFVVAGRVLVASSRAARPTTTSAAATGSEAIDNVLVHTVTLTARQPVLAASEPGTLRQYNEGGRLACRNRRPSWFRSISRMSSVDVGCCLTANTNNTDLKYINR